GRSDPLQHRCDRCNPDLAAWLVNGGQRNRQQVCVLDIVNAHNSHIMWNLITSLDQRVHDLSRCSIIGANDRPGLQPLDDAAKIRYVVATKSLNEGRLK